MSLRARALYAAGKMYWRLFRPVTMGVRLLLIRGDEVLLVKHTYQPGWFLPGGGVKRKETLEAVARREAWEEVGARLGELQFFGMYSNLNQHKSDHIAVFLCRKFRVEGKPDFEIDEVRLFPMQQLPPDIHSGSKERILEYQRGQLEPGVGTW